MSATPSAIGEIRESPQHPTSTTSELQLLGVRAPGQSGMPQQGSEQSLLQRIPWFGLLPGSRSNAANTLRFSGDQTFGNTVHDMLAWQYPVSCTSQATAATEQDQLFHGLRVRIGFHTGMCLLSKINEAC